MKTFEPGQKVWLFQWEDLPLDEVVIKSVSPTGAVIRVTAKNGTEMKLPERNHWRLYDDAQAQRHDAALAVKRAYRDAREEYKKAALRLDLLMDGRRGGATPEATEQFKRATALLNDVVAAMKQEGGK